jgi:hypothetical protein
MGSIREELRRFERRRLRPLFRRFKRHRDEPAVHVQPPPAAAAGDDVEELLVALVRAELRRRAGEPVATVPAAVPPIGGGSEAERLVRSLLATRADAPAAAMPRGEAA